MQVNCPSCGHHETLECIAEQIRLVKEEGKRRERELANSFSQVDLIADSIAAVGKLLGVEALHGVADVEIAGRKTCVRCGTWWKPDAGAEAERLRAELLKITNEVYTPIERLAKLSDSV